MSGLQIFNGGNELVVSTSAKLLSFVAKNTHESIVAAWSIVGTNTTYIAGYVTSLIRVPPNTPFILAMDLPYGKFVGILSCVYIGTEGANNLFRITAYCGDGTTMSAQSPLDIWAFGYQPNTYTNYGLTLHDTNGALAADFLRPHPLFPKFIGTWPKGYQTSNLGIPSLARPIIFGMPAYYRGESIYHPNDPGALFTYIKAQKMWALLSGPSISCGEVTLKQEDTNEEPTDDVAMIDGPSNGVVMEGVWLP